MVAEFVKKDETPDFDQGTYVKIKDQWADFVKYKNSEEAKKRSKINTDNAALKKHHHRTGRGGYRAAKPKWNQMEMELVKKGKHPETFDWDERTTNWFYGIGRAHV